MGTISKSYATTRFRIHRHFVAPPALSRRPMKNDFQLGTPTVAQQKDGSISHLYKSKPKKS